VPSQVPPPSGVQPRPSAEGETGGRGESQLTTQSPDRPKEGEEDFNSSLGLISLARTSRTYLIRVFWKTSFVIMFLEYPGCVDLCDCFTLRFEEY